MPLKEFYTVRELAFEWDMKDDNLRHALKTLKMNDKKLPNGSNRQRGAKTFQRIPAKKLIRLKAILKLKEVSGMNLLSINKLPTPMIIQLAKFLSK